MNVPNDLQPDGVDSIVVTDSPIVIGRGRETACRLLQPTISRKHATMRPSEDGFVIEDHDSKYGTFVNGNRVRLTTVRPGDRVQFGTTVFFRVTEEGLVRDATPHGISLAVRSISIARGEDVLVKDASFRIAPDSFVGILGPSGAGKSTLLNCIASYLPPGKGQVVFDEEHEVGEHKDEYRAAIGHVPQDDVVHGSLSVRENLSFAARLRLGGDPTAQDLVGEVDRVLQHVDLAEHAEKPTSKLSGGQRKRVSVAMELVKHPRLLLLDEPTSGLDPATEAHLMEQLRYISRQGTTVVCTTHMMENIRLLDTLIVLGVMDGKGRIAYVGPPDDLLHHFKCRNLADLYERLAGGRFNPVVSEFLPHDDAPTELDQGAETTSHPDDKSIDPKSGTSEIVASAHQKTRQLITSRPDDNAWDQLAMMCQQGSLLIWRDRQLILSLVGQPVVLGLLVCLTQYNASRLVSLLFFAIVITIWLGLNNSARELVRERKHYIRDRLAGLRPGVYLAGKVVVHGVIGAMQIALLLLLIRFVSVPLLDSAGRKPQADDLQQIAFTWLFLVLMLCYLGALGMGLLLSALVRTEETAVAALPLLIMPQLLLSVVGTLQIEEVYSRGSDPRPFRPLVAKLRSEERLPLTAAFLDLASLACFTRPAILLTAKPAPSVPPEIGKWYWLADLLHLLILVQLIWIVTCLAFGWAEQRWASLIGVG